MATVCPLAFVTWFALFRQGLCLGFKLNWVATVCRLGFTIWLHIFTPEVIFQSASLSQVSCRAVVPSRPRALAQLGRRRIPFMIQADEAHGADRADGADGVDGADGMSKRSGRS